MKKGPDVVVVMVVVFVLGTVFTGVSHADIEFVSLMGQVFTN
ncbi:hypothetical protein Q4488_17520 [Amphritea sp. 1_MG-2023]|nr:hypothetical protein [Amphritea sp. 1_MG-2023]MDO6565180.1 hypothetical protein [Amphritea sp. 1_MG-2023]